ncbi:MAG: lysyl-tRNA synthetase class I [Hyphomonadaceae bacterium]|nr:MAG: lysyl-tRNA synthetase class I [Hyphomonadaceae bacterium]
MVDYAIAYYHDFIMPKKSYREPSEKEKAAILALRDKFAALGDCRDGEIIQNQVYQIGKDFEFEPLRDWFKALYEVLLGQETGPRFGNFAALFGLEATIALMNEKLGETE